MSHVSLKDATFAPDKQIINNHNPDILIYFSIFPHMTCMISFIIPHVLYFTCVLK